jgi:hypothetical protein
MWDSIRIPVTGAVPLDDSLEHRSISVEAVSIRLNVRVQQESRCMIFLYAPQEQVRERLERIPLVMEWESRSFKTKGVRFEDTGLVSKHGPLAVKEFGDGYFLLDSVDDTPYESDGATHDGKPIGAVLKQKLLCNRHPAPGELRDRWDPRTALTESEQKQMWTMHIVNNVWRLEGADRPVARSGSNPVFDKNVELLVYMDCGPGWEGNAETVGAQVLALTVDVYYSCNDTPLE